MSKTFRYSEREGGILRPKFNRADEFRCRHCRAYVGAIPCGGRNRNHCPYCLYSRHVDGKTPGDRASTCGGSMMPVAYFIRPKGEVVVVHRCQVCGFERHCRVAADDDLDLVLSLPQVAPRLAGRRDIPVPKEESA